MHLSGNKLELYSCYQKTRQELIESILANADFSFLVKNDYLPCLLEGTKKTQVPCHIWRIKIKNGEMVGLVILKNINKKHETAELLISLNSNKYKQTDYFSELTHLILDYVFLTLGLRRIEVNVPEIDRVLQKAYKKIGFQEEGLLRGKYLVKKRPVDVYIMSLLRVEWERQRLDCKYAK